MSGSNDGHSMQLWPYAQAAGQDRQYFPLGTCKARAGLTDAIIEENERFRNNLTKLLGSRAAADAYIRNRPNSAIAGYWNAKRP
jgi:hypothetical protein